MGIPPILNVCRHDTDNRALVTPTGEIGLKPAPLTPTPLTPTPAERCPHDGRRTIHVDVDVCALIHTFVGILVRPRDALPLTPVLPSGVRTSLIPKGLDHRSSTRWSP